LEISVTGNLRRIFEFPVPGLSLRGQIGKENL